MQNSYGLRCVSYYALRPIAPYSSELRRLRRWLAYHIISYIYHFCFSARNIGRAVMWLAKSPVGIPALPTEHVDIVKWREMDIRKFGDSLMSHSPGVARGTIPDFGANR